MRRDVQDPLLAASPEETRTAGSSFASTLRPGHVVALHGDLGSGKTTFVRGVVEGLGGNPDPVSSPTFVIVQSYASPVAQIHHMDAYRIRAESELDEMGFDEYFDGASIVLVEWPERVLSRLPAATVHVTLAHHSETTRSIAIKYSPEDVRCKDE